MGHDIYKIPIQLCQWVLQEKFSKPFALFLSLKDRCSGVFIENHIDVEEIIRQLGYKSTRSYFNNLQELQKKTSLDMTRRTGPITSEDLIRSERFMDSHRLLLSNTIKKI
jgi:hypothetical protein